MYDGILMLLLGLSGAAYFYGAWKLAQYGFRVSGAVGIACLVVPFFAVFFGAFKLREDGKELPMSLMLAGFFSAAVLGTVLFATTKYGDGKASGGISDAVIAEYGADSMKKKAEEALKNAPKIEVKEDPTPTPPPAPVNNGTNNGAANGTNQAAPPNGAPPAEAPKEAAPKEAAPKEAPAAP